MVLPTSYSVQVIEEPKSSLGEAPHWDIARQSLYYVDIFAEKPTILRYDAVLDQTFVAVVGEFLLAIYGSKTLNENLYNRKRSGSSFIHYPCRR